MGGSDGGEEEGREGWEEGGREEGEGGADSGFVGGLECAVILLEGEKGGKGGEGRKGGARNFMSSTLPLQVHFFFVYFRVGGISRSLNKKCGTDICFSCGWFCFSVE